ncbi:tol-pal system protein YbgF [Lacimicrobium alkaliphilum]|uniref:Cell division coordinator CpoB n=1 Tax=Lacimicrobium alkaliphilum TaxID=1526571 RepID=A0ABQ1RQ87_9ALTE|nr:tol-pal system protein YbgF [Lacimicrobium alkaliphilum]GGD75753.1 tol-pal system protein YbgF [Lacimicrobium alkaliphilum]
MIYRGLAVVSCLAIGATAIAAPAPVSDLSAGSLESRIATLERMVEARSGAQHNIQRQLVMMQQEVNELRGSVEEHSYKLEQILQRQRELYIEIDNRMQSLSSPANMPSQANADDAAGTPEISSSSLGEDDAYDRAVNLILREKRYDQAIPEFKAFLQQYPGSSYAANAHYWLGQLLFNKQEWAESSTHFETVVSDYPGSNKRADSLLKLGMIAQNQSNLARAQQLFEQVIRDYPESSARKLAEPRLRAVKNNG